METGKPSRTAWSAAIHRAAHQVVEQGRIFHDPLALLILGTDAGTVERDATLHPSRRGMRNFIAARTRFAEDALAAAVEQGAGQVVILGAGLDTYAYRSSLDERVRIFEVDHPATQAWKRRRLCEAAIPLPACLTFAPVDFEKDTLAAGLSAAGFDSAAQTFFTWLGVVPYLTREAIWSTLGFIAGMPNGSQVVFDYGDPPESLAPEMRAILDRYAARAAALGEDWVSFFHPEDLRAKLTSLGFSEIEDLGPREIASRYFPDRAASLPARGGHMLRASK